MFGFLLAASIFNALLMPVSVGGGALADLTGRNVPLVFGVCGLLAMASVLTLFSRRATRRFLSSL